MRNYEAMSSNVFVEAKLNHSSSVFQPRIKSYTRHLPRLSGCFDRQERELEGRLAIHLRLPEKNYLPLEAGR